MERSKTEQALEELLPRLEAEHDVEQDESVREAIWTLLTAAEDYLMERQKNRVTASRPSGPSQVADPE